MTWGAAISAGAGLVGGAMGGGGGDGKIRPMDNIPEFLRDDYRAMAGQVSGLQAPEYYQGNTVAGMNPMMQQSLQDMGSWGQQGGVGYGAMNTMMGAGNEMMGAYGKGMDLLDQQQARGPNQFQYDQGTYDQSFGNLSGGMQNSFDLASGQMQQGFEWGDLKNLNMQNALGGGQGSSGLYQDSALGQAMTDQNKMNFGASMWQNAANQANQGAMSAGAQNLASANQFDQEGVANYGRFGQMGANMLGQGFDMGMQNMGVGLDAGQIQQGYDQSLVDADKARWDYNQNLDMNHLRNQMGMIPGPGGYSPGSGGMTNWEGALQGAQVGLGLYGAGQDAGWWGGGGNVLPDMTSPFGTGSTPGEVGYIDF